MNDYHLVGAQAGMLILNSPRYGRQVWATRRSRKHKQCLTCRATIAVGAEPYAPITNKGNRKERICETCATRLIEIAEAAQKAAGATPDEKTNQGSNLPQHLP